MADDNTSKNCRGGPLLKTGAYLVNWAEKVGIEPSRSGCAGPVRLSILRTLTGSSSGNAHLLAKFIRTAHILAVG
jgi:hypothetical protein